MKQDSVNEASPAALCRVAPAQLWRRCCVGEEEEEEEEAVICCSSVPAAARSAPPPWLQPSAAPSASGGTGCSSVRSPPLTHKQSQPESNYLV